MKRISNYIEFINELFDSENNYNIISVNRTQSSYYAHEILIEIKGYTYRFIIQLKNGNLYFDYYIKDWQNNTGGDPGKNKHIHGHKLDKFNKYDFIINDSMFISVLNAIPHVFQAFVNQAIKDDMGDSEVKSIYYDSDEDRRTRIYEYFFKQKLPNAEYTMELGWYFFKLNPTVKLKDFKLV